MYFSSNLASILVLKNLEKVRKKHGLVWKLNPWENDRLLYHHALSVIQNKILEHDIVDDLVN